MISENIIKLRINFRLYGNILKQIRFVIYVTNLIMKDIAGNDYTTSFNRQVNLQVQIGIFKQYYIGSEKK